MNFLVWIFLIIFLSACTSGPSLQEMKAADPPKDDNLIVPGWRVGKVYLGMTSTELLAAMGEPSSTKPGEESNWFSWKNAELDVSLDKKADQVVKIALNDERYKTAEGVRVGLSELSVGAKLGQPQASSSDGVYCYKRGILLEFDEYSYATTDSPRRRIPYQVTHIHVMPSKEWRRAAPYHCK